MSTLPTNSVAAESSEPGQVAGLRAAIRPVTLRFADPALERAFAAQAIARLLPRTRLALVAGAVLYALFAVLDAALASAQLTQLLVIRSVLIAMLVATAAATYAVRGRAWLQAILSAAVLAAGLGIVAMTAILPLSVASLYYAGLIVVVVYASVMLPLHYRALAVVSTLLFAAYQATALAVNPVPGWVLVSNDLFLASTMGIAVVGKYIQERSVRRDFLHASLLRRETERSATLLDAANAASRAKSEFLATMSHELRTPLNAVIGFSDMLRHEVLGPLGGDRYRSYAEDIHASGRHLLSIVNDVLDLSKAEAGRMTLVEEPVDLVAVVEDALRLFRDRTAEGVRVSFDRPDGPVRLRADARLVKQVVINLVSNAVKFTLAGGSVTVSIVTAAPGGAEGGCDLVVADTGVGIEPEHLARVLEPFVQVENAFTRARHGTGLGLPLVKRLLDLHDGTLLLTSTPGVGTVAVARFPAARLLAGPGRTATAAA